MKLKTAIILMSLTLLTCTCLTFHPCQAVTSTAWETIASMNVARSSLGATVVDGAIYAIGGVNDPPSYVTCTGANEKYEPETNQWTTKASMLTPRASFAIAVVDGKIFCIGGTTGLEDGQVIVSGVNEVYDPQTDSWNTKSAMPTPRVGVTAGVVDGKIYVIGGNSDVTEVYDPKTDTWANKSSMLFKPGLRLIWSCTSTVLDGKIHVFGAFPYSASHQVYDPAVDKWSLEEPIVQGYLLASAAATSSPKGAWVFGVDSTWWDAGPPNFTSLTWDSQQKCWRVCSLMSTPRVNAALATLDDAVYVIGGSIVMIENNAHPTTLVEKYTPQKDAPTDIQAPEVTVLLSPEKTYTSTVAIDFTLNKPAQSFLLGVDGQTLVSVQGNTSLTFQPGNHSITVYAVDYSGNIGASKTVTFNVSDAAEVSVFWLVLVAGGAFAFFVGVFLVWLHFSRRKT
ncbi:MAG: Kelch repeat-containing protein [Candidatus Bathyarchaeia archaeon]